MKLFALCLLLVLIAVSGCANWVLLSKLTSTQGYDGLVFGCWFLALAHLLAGCLMTAAYLDGERR